MAAPWRRVTRLTAHAFPEVAALARDPWDLPLGGLDMLAALSAVRQASFSQEDWHRLRRRIVDTRIVEEQRDGVLVQRLA